MPAARVQWRAMRAWRMGGIGDVEGRMRRRSQWMFEARRGLVEIVWGRIIQRITRDMVIGLRSEVERVLRNAGIVVEGVREMRLMVQSGIFVVWRS